MKDTLSLVDIEQVIAAQQRLSGVTVRTPLLPVKLPNASGQVFLKNEALQRTGKSFERNSLCIKNIAMQITSSKLLS